MANPEYLETTTDSKAIPKWVAVLRDAEEMAKSGKVAEADALNRIACSYVANSRG